MGDDGWKDMPALMSQETIEALSSALKTLCSDQSTPFATVLHGGEPLMMGARRLAYLLSKLRGVLPLTHPLCIQTNGTLITDEILDTCAAHHVAISVSIDGPKPVNDKFRIGHKGESTFDKLVAGIDRLRNHPKAAQLYSGLLAVIDPLSDPAEVYWFLKKLGAPSVDFLHRDGNHSNLPFGKESFESVEYGTWLLELFDTYLSDTSPIKIRFLDDLMKISMGGRGVKEGIGQKSYGILIVETDGALTKNDTLKSSFDGADKFETHWNVRNDQLSKIVKSEEFSEYHRLQVPSAIQCKTCPQLASCGGGMPLHRWHDKNGYDNPSVYCNDQKYLIQKINTRLKEEGVIS